MKKSIIIALSLILVFVIGVSIAVSIYFKPIAKEMIQTQLAKQGYEKATIGDISVGLYKTTISDLALNNPGQTKIGEISVTYWPTQLMNKRVGTVTASQSNIDVLIKQNGDVYIADYLVYNLLTAETKIKKTQYYYDQSNFSLIKKAHAATPSASLPLDAVAADDLNLSIKMPSGKTIKTTINAAYDIGTNHVEGDVLTKDTPVAALIEFASLAKPSAVQGIRNASGAISTDLSFDLKNLNTPNVIGGKGDIVVKNLSLEKDGITIKNLNTSIGVTNLMPFSTQESQKVTIDAIQKSIITARDISVDFGLKDTTKLDLNSSLVHLSGGTITTAPFSADLANVNGIINVSLNEINLLDFSRLLGLDLLIKGEVNADIPLTIKNNQVIITRSTVNLLLESITGANIEKTANDLIDGAIKGTSDGAKAGRDIAKDVLKGFMGGFGGSGSQKDQ